MKLRLKKKQFKIILTPLLFLLALTIPFLILELILRMTIDPYSTNGSTCTSSQLFEKYYVMNSKDMRDREFRYIKDDNTFRILVLGDSITFGQGVKDYMNTYPKMLEKRLNSVESDITFEVINTGKQGWNTKDELNFLKSEGIKYSPDLIILGYVFNDAEEVSYNPIKFNMPEKESIFDKLYFFLYQNTYTLCIIKDHPMRYGKLFTKIKYNPLFLRLNLIKPGFSSFNYTNHTFKAYSEDSLEKNRELLEELIKFSRENDMEVLIQIFPAAIGDTKEDNKFFLLHDFIKKIARDNKVHVIDLINYFEVEIKKGHKLSVNAIDGHPNERAHWITSEVLYRKLVKEKLVPVE